MIHKIIIAVTNNNLTSINFRNFITIDLTINVHASINERDRVRLIEV
jgi:hypothetical protein